MSPVPSGRAPRIGSQATSDTPSVDSRVGGLENELVRLRDSRVAKKEEAIQVRLRGAGIVDVRHSLGATPILCELKEVVSAVGAATPFGVAQPYRKGEWNETLCRMDVAAVSGSLDNCVATFIVKAG